MPDFVLQQAAHATEGSGRRELGDRLLLAGGRGAVVQVKARTFKPKPEDREAGWMQKVAAKAMSQAEGTARQLRMVPADMANCRGRILDVDGNAYEWIAVFLLDHPAVPENTVVTWQPVGMPATTLTRRDWDFPSTSCAPPLPCSTTSSAPPLDPPYRSAKSRCGTTGSPPRTPPNRQPVPTPGWWGRVPPCSPRRSCHRLQPVPTAPTSTS
jgi:hypothetical protein